MPKIAAPISDVALKAHKPRDKFYKVSVGGDGRPSLGVSSTAAQSRSIERP